jgi:tight adherence protein C
MLIAITIIISYLFTFVLLCKVEIKEYCPSSKFLTPFYKISISFVEVLFKSKSGFFKKHFLKPHVIESLKQINPTDRSSQHIKEYYVEKIALSLLTLFAGSILAFISIFSQRTEHIIIEDKYLERGSYIEGQKSRKLKVSVEDELENEEIELKIDEQQLTEAEVFEIFRQAEERIDSQLLGKNSSFMEVRCNLNLPTKLEGLPIQITWETDNYEILGMDGEVNNTELEETGILVTLTAALTYKAYNESYEIQVKVLPPAWSERDILLKNILEKVKISSKNSITSKYLELPQSINGKLILWSENGGNSGTILLFLTIIAAILLCYGKDKDLEEKVKKREKQLLSDYPDIVSKLTLLLGAGMTVKSAWQRVSIDYRKKKQADSKYYRYAYEEMLITYYEMAGGVSESKAYEDFGKRCKNQRYMKLSALITQNLRKGSRGLSKILESESVDAFEHRKAYAKTIGEEAGTKLMIPMFINLILVLVMIMIPACMSFQM